MRTDVQRASVPRWLALPAVAAAAAFLAAACSSSTKTSVSSSGSPSSVAASSSSSPGTMFSTANVSGLGTVVVDGRGRTVYVLTADGTTNVTCDDASGCTKIWPDLPFPNGTSSATAGTGVHASLLGSMKLSDGETYPTYNKWLMYEYVADTGPAQGHGEGINSFGGTWYALDASGNLVKPGAGATGGAGGGGY